MGNRTIKFKRFHENASMPLSGTAFSAGCDLYAVTCDVDWDKGIVTYGTGIGVEIPAYCVGLVFPRSSVYKKEMTLANCVGVIDPDYRGEIKAVFRIPKNYFQDPSLANKIYAVGERVCQLVIIPYIHAEWVESDELSPTVRGSGGFGSTGA